MSTCLNKNTALHVCRTSLIPSLKSISKPQTRDVQSDPLIVKTMKSLQSTDFYFTGLKSFTHLQSENLQERNQSGESCQYLTLGTGLSLTMSECVLTISSCAPYFFHDLQLCAGEAVFFLLGQSSQNCFSNQRKKIITADTLTRMQKKVLSVWQNKQIQRANYH